MLSAVSIALLMLFFLFTMDALNQFIKVLEGMKAAAMPFSMVILGMAAITAVIVVPEYYRRARDLTEMLSRFFMVTAIEAALIAGLELIRLFMFSRAIPDRRSLISTVWNTSSYVEMIGGGAFMILCGALWLYYRRRIPPKPGRRSFQ